MGTTNSNCSCLQAQDNTLIQKNKNKIESNNTSNYEIYESIKYIDYVIKKQKKITLSDCFLISTKTIPKLIDLIKNSGIFKGHPFVELDKNLLTKYNKEKDIKIYSDYKICQEIAEKDDENENEFLIVDNNFLKAMEIKENNNNVYLIVDNENSIMKIFFPVSQSEINIKEKNKIFYKFVVEKSGGGEYLPNNMFNQINNLVNNNFVNNNNINNPFNKIYPYYNNMYNMSNYNNMSPYYY